MKTLIFGLATSLLAALPAFADVHLTMRDGRVSIVAKDATVRQILTEWARVGQTKIVNVERIPGSPVTLELDNVTEAQALDVLLRSLSGYIAAPRSIGAANLSYYDRIIIMPTLAAARPAVSASAAASASASASPSPAVFQQAPQAPPFPPPVEDRQYDERPEPTAAESAPNVAEFPSNVAVPPELIRPPAPNTFQRGLEEGRPAVFRGQPQAPVTHPSAPLAPFGGVAVPGMIAPAPPQPGQPGPIQPSGAPGQPVRRPGGL